MTVEEAWRRVRLKHLASEPIRNGLGEAAHYDDPTWPRYIRITDFAGPRELRPETFKTLPPNVAQKAPVKQNDLLLAAVGATFGTSYLHAEPDGLACFAGYLVKFTASDEADPRFVAYWAQSHPYWHQVRSRVVQSTIQNFSASRYRELQIDVPVLDLQSIIADFLDRETGRIDLLVEKKRRLIELLEEKRTALISHAVTKGLDPSVDMKDSGIAWLGDIPAHWRSLPLSRISYQMTNGYVGPTRDILVPEGVPYVQSLHVKEGRVRHADDYFVSREWHLQHDRTRLREGDVLLVQTGDIGQSAVVAHDIAGANCHALIITRVRPAVVDPWFLGYLLRSEGGNGAVLATRTGATHPHLNVGYVRDVRLPVPPVEEQREIVRRLDCEVDAVTRTVEKIRIQLDKLAEYRQALITAAVTGQIDITSEAAEPEEAIA